MMKVNCSRPFFQIAWIVDDLDAAVGQWLTQGIGPFFLFRHSPVLDFKYRGTASDIDFSVALAQYGAMQIELIQQHGDRPSQYRDSFAPGEGGFHHMARLTSDLDADIEMYRKQGFEPAAEGTFGDMRFAYIDTRPALGHMTEIMEDKASIREMFDLVTQSSLAWDGSDPVRTI